MTAYDVTGCSSSVIRNDCNQLAGHQQVNGQTAQSVSDLPHGHMKELTWLRKDLPDGGLCEKYMVYNLWSML